MAGSIEVNFRLPIAQLVLWNPPSVKANFPEAVFHSFSYRLKSESPRDKVRYLTAPRYGSTMRDTLIRRSAMAMPSSANSKSALRPLPLGGQAIFGMESRASRLFLSGVRGFWETSPTWQQCSHTRGMAASTTVELPVPLDPWHNSQRRERDMYSRSTDNSTLAPLDIYRWTAYDM
jgi:hypothetical protein